MPVCFEHLVPRLDGVVPKHPPSGLRHWRTRRNNKRLLKAMVLDRLDVEFNQVKDAEKAARDTLDQLAGKGLLDKRKTTLEGKSDVVLFRPYGADLSKSDVSGLRKYPPDTPHPPVPLKCVQPQTSFFTLILFLQKVQRVKGGRRVFLQSPGVCSDSSNQKRQYLL